MDLLAMADDCSSSRCLSSDLKSSCLCRSMMVDHPAVSSPISEETEPHPKGQIDAVDGHGCGTMAVLKEGCMPNEGDEGVKVELNESPSHQSNDSDERVEVENHDPTKSSSSDPTSLKIRCKNLTQPAICSQPDRSNTNDEHTSLKESDAPSLCAPFSERLQSNESPRRRSDKVRRRRLRLAQNRTMQQPSLATDSAPVSKKRSFTDAFSPDTPHDKGIIATTTDAENVVLGLPKTPFSKSASNVQFAPSSAVEFEPNEPVTGNLTPIPADVAAQRFPTKLEPLSQLQQAELDEAKRNDALLKSFDDMCDDDDDDNTDRKGSNSRRQSIYASRRKRRKSFYLPDTSERNTGVPVDWNKSANGDDAVAAATTCTAEMTDNGVPERRLSRELFPPQSQDSSTC